MLILIYLRYHNIIRSIANIVRPGVQLVIFVTFEYLKIFFLITALYTVMLKLFTSEDMVG